MGQTETCLLVEIKMNILKQIQRVCPKCGYFLAMTTPPYFRRKAFKCENPECGKFEYVFNKKYSCQKCEDGRLILTATGKGYIHGEVRNKEFIYVCDLCDYITVHDESIT